MTPTPLAPSARALRDHRYHVNVHGPRNERGGYPFVAEGRFADIASARNWADTVHPDAYLIAIDYLSARTGWRTTRAATRTDGTWDR